MSRAVLYRTRHAPYRTFTLYSAPRPTGANNCTQTHFLTITRTHQLGGLPLGVMHLCSRAATSARCVPLPRYALVPLLACCNPPCPTRRRRPRLGGWGGGGLVVVARRSIARARRPSTRNLLVLLRELSTARARARSTAHANRRHQVSMDSSSIHESYSALGEVSNSCSSRARSV